jgi:hypothetical protein
MALQPKHRNWPYSAALRRRGGAVRFAILGRQPHRAQGWDAPTP